MNTLLVLLMVFSAYGLGVFSTLYERDKTGARREDVWLWVGLIANGVMFLLSVSLFMNWWFV